MRENQLNVQDAVALKKIDVTKPLKNDNLTRSDSKLFPINTYAESSRQRNKKSAELNSSSEILPENWQSVAERINELEKASSQYQENAGYTYLDPSKTTRVPNPTLKVIQKNAVQSYFQRQQASVRENFNGLARPKSLHFVKNPSDTLQRSSLSGYVMVPLGHDGKNATSLTNTFDYKTSVSTSDLNLKSNIDQNNYFDKSQTSSSINLKEAKDDTPPRPPPRNRQSFPARRTSSASEYSSLRDKILASEQHLSKDLLGPMILGSVISIDDWVPERPPKNPALRVPSPELPPPPPVVVSDISHELARSDDPLPPPPAEDILKRSVFIDKNYQNKQLLLTPCRRNSFAGQSYKPMYRSNGLENLTKMPPAIPKKPFDLQKRSSNPILNSQQTERFTGNPDKIQSKVPSKLNDATAKISARKRPHNMQNTLGIPLVQERQIPPAPPLKPRTLIQQ